MGSQKKPGSDRNGPGGCERARFLCVVSHVTLAVEQLTMGEREEDP